MVIHFLQEHHFSKCSLWMEMCSTQNLGTHNLGELKLMTQFYTTTSNPRLYFFFGLNKLLCILATITKNWSQNQCQVETCNQFNIKKFHEDDDEFEIFFTTKKAKDLKFYFFPNLCICCILKCIKYFFESHNVTRSPFHCLPYNSISLQ